MEKQKKVLDASVIMKIFTNEKNSDKALAIIEDYESEKTDIIVPELVFLEVLNALRYKKKNEDELKKASNQLFDLELKTEKISSSILNKAINISLEHNITIYDALYVSLAQFNGCPLITADKELFKLPNVIPLEKID
ncbi:MAG: type II toxin-antitoxin system VapC family toxin [Nanoarchaeota archaeon]